jgi:glycosyltransferase involved in cell wall biosynthesis
LQKRVTFTPHERDIAGAYTRFDVLVLPSKDNDPFGMVAAEALSLGIPVIVTDQCGIADYLTNEKDALIVKAGSAKELSAAIIRMTESKTRIALAKAGQKTAEKKFSIKTMVERYEDVLTGKVPVSSL